MNVLSKKNIRFMATFSMMVFLHGSIGCHYYKIDKRVENQQVPPEVKALAAKGGDPVSSTAQFKEGTPVMVQLMDGTLIKKQFIVRDCTHVYLGKKAPTIDQEVALKDVRYMKKALGKEYFIVHNGFQVYHLKYVSLNDSKTEIQGEIEPLPSTHQAYLTTKEKPRRANKYNSMKLDPSHEIHLYSTGMKVTKENFVAIPLSSIKKLEIYEEDGATSAVNAFLTVVGMLAVVTIIVAATKSSCPFVYVRNDSAFTFVGEIYGGAIYPSLERDDYLPLGGIHPIAGSYQIKISNELLERQYTDLAELILVDHEDNTSALIDQEGIVQIVGKPESPLSAVDGSGIKRTTSILQKDSSSYLFNETQPGQEIRSLTLSFKKPVNTRSARLILRAKNSYWLDFVYGKFTEQFGTSYQKFIEKQRKVPASKLLKWGKEQNIPLTVQVETASGWKTIDRFHVIGPLASRDLVMSVDLSESTGEYANIRLETGYQFWEVDYAALDFTDQPAPVITCLAPSAAADENGKDVMSTLLSVDHLYLSQAEIGNEAVVTYPATEQHGKRTVFLHTRGYYEHIRNYKNKPNWAEIYSFRKKGALGLFARKQLEKLEASQELLPIDAINVTGVISNQP